MNELITDELVVEQGFVHCEVQTLEMVSKSVYRLCIRPDAELIYKPGQYLKIRSQNNSWLAFSIANANSNLLELHIRLNPQDQNLMFLLQEIAATKRLTISGPFGVSYYRPNNFRNIIIAVGTGFAPAKSIIEATIASENYPRSLHLYWGCRLIEDFYLPLLPPYWQQNHSWFSYTSVLTEGSSIKNQNIILDNILRDYQYFHDCQVYFYGPQDMARSLQTILLSRGLANTQLLSDML